MASAAVITPESSLPLAHLPRVSCLPWLCAIVVLASDGIAVTVSGSLVLLGDGGTRGDWKFYLSLWPLLGVFFAILAAHNLYPGIVHNAVNELRRLGLGLSTSFLVLASAVFFTHTAGRYSRGIFLLWWLVTLLVTPMLRSMLRALFCHMSWWGVPLAVFYTGDASAEILREMEKHPETGLKPVVVLAGPHAIWSSDVLPVVETRFTPAIRRCGISRAMIALPAAGSAKLMQDLEGAASFFPHLMIMHPSPGLYSLTMEACPIATTLGVDVKRQLLLPLPRLVKRVMDLLLSCLGLPVVGLAIGLLGFLVWLESPGPIFFGHRRIGRSHVAFLAWKLRTMRVNSEQLLQQTLLHDGALREEWLRHRKLRCDPRVTPLGRFLRRTSLDELPQLWNVLRGEMSLVGPRPIVEEEVADYGQEFSLYCRVTPGITGLWQISGRNTVSTRERVRLDSYYVRNWSPWLDLHILARTAWVVLTGQGAY